MADWQARGSSAAKCAGEICDQRRPSGASDGRGTPRSGRKIERRLGRRDDADEPLTLLVCGDSGRGGDRQGTGGAALGPLVAVDRPELVCRRVDDIDQHPGGAIILIHLLDRRADGLDLDHALHGAGRIAAAAVAGLDRAKGVVGVGAERRASGVVQDVVVLGHRGLIRSVMMQC